MILVSTTAGNEYCIDELEVTQAEYQQFLDSGASAASQPRACMFNTTFQPKMDPQGTCDDVGARFSPGQYATYPVTCVNWCDARAYCAWAGKRLCGQVGGGAVNLADAANADKDEWYNACSFQGTKAYPYGNTYEPTTCNGYDFGSLNSYYFPSSIMPGCEGGFPGLFQMSGNVAEWTDACNGASGETDLCPARGADGNSSEMFLGCAVVTEALLERGRAARGAGIRCCATTLKTGR